MTIKELDARMRRECKTDADVQAWLDRERLAAGETPEEIANTNGFMDGWFACLKEYGLGHRGNRGALDGLYCIFDREPGVANDYDKGRVARTLADGRLLIDRFSWLFNGDADVMDATILSEAELAARHVRWFHDPAVFRDAAAEIFEAGVQRARDRRPATRPVTTEPTT
jgi:hypothetical protein